MKKLLHILPEKGRFKIIGNKHIDINKIELDSRKIVAGDLFVAIKGTLSDGHDFIENAIASGCTCVVSERAIENVNPDVCYIIVKDSRKFLGQIVNIYFDYPSSKLKLIGVTGTNGKTSVVAILYKLFKRMGFKVGLISTVENLIHEDSKPAEHTTPDVINLTRLIAEMVDAGCDYAFMEVSSHAIHQERIAGQRFEGGIFTNITHDHLDYHDTFKEYIRVKKLFFDMLSKEAFALVNVDDKHGDVMIQNCEAKQYRYSLQTLVDYKAKIISSDFSGLQLDINGTQLHSLLLGKFNAYNLLAAYGVAELLGYEENEILHALSSVSPVEGRFDVLYGKEGRVGIVDYAHTPDALEKIITSIKSIQREKRLIAVVGCGGDRDKAKRPVMGKIAASLTEVAIFTADNPRSESPEEILSEMQTILTEGEKENVVEVVDRYQAIKTAVKISSPGDVILIAGKGHEKYQEIKGEKVPFDDKEKLRALLS